MFDKFREECGVFGIYGHEEAARLTYLGLYALQHRGQESAGIVSSDGEQLYSERGMGHVSDIFGEEQLMRLPGSSAIGHVRYSTAGKVSINEAQPFSSSAVTDRSQSATMGTCPMRPRRGVNSKTKVRSSRRPRILKSFCTGSPDREPAI